LTSLLLIAGGCFNPADPEAMNAMGTGGLDSEADAMESTPSTSHQERRESAEDASATTDDAEEMSSTFYPTTVDPAMTSGESTTVGPLDDSGDETGLIETLAECGDGMLQDGEECDDGELNAETGACLPMTCRLNVCRDGFHNPSQEECDDGNAINSDECSNDCTIARCGDTIVQASRGETCDQGSNNAFADGGCHPVDCTFIVCGDGVTTRPVESCDDGNQNNNDACGNDCVSADCGDGVIQDETGEECDDGDSDNTDLCTTACSETFCGDGIVQAVRNEECDDGNSDNTDTCSNGCVRQDICYRYEDDPDAFIGGSCPNGTRRYCVPSSAGDSDIARLACEACAGVQCSLTATLCTQGDGAEWGFGIATPVTGGSTITTQFFLFDSQGCRPGASAPLLSDGDVYTRIEYRVFPGGGTAGLSGSYLVQ